MAEAFVALGSNLGDREENLTAARAALAGGVLAQSAASSIYETAPWGPVPQGRYLNQVVRGTTALPPRALLLRLLTIERALGRDRESSPRYGPRTIDLDILLYDELEWAEPDLKIPHPRLLERAFVLVPLAEIAPNLVVKGVPIRDALARIGRKGVMLYANSL